ncbi:MAG: TlyA family RNA methyltransferase [Acidaminococcus sp.]|nr:TlyA family RNA methyltransferase [Acidaminococcus sp.]
MYMKKERLDVFLTEQGFFESRSKAQAVIMAGEVLVNDQKIDKPGTMVKPDAKITLLGKKMPFVSRGGYKLDKSLKVFPISLEGKVVADLGASTGGFTDCALQHGAVKVYAVDVGYGQLAWKLRTDARVRNMERTNIRTVTPEMIGEPLDFASIDVAFISLTKVLPVAYTLLKETGEIVALIKPQFEAGRENVGKKGVVRDPAVHEDVIRKVAAFARETGFCPLALTYSPVKGPEGNIEYLIYLTRAAGEDTVTEERLQEVVAEAHADLDH